MITVASLFSGCGGLDLGFQQAGYTVVWSNDIDEDANLTYAANFNHKSDSRSIRDIATSDIPDTDIIIGGFPCQPFSSAGKKKGAEDERGDLFLECIRIINDKNPKAFLLENVRGLLNIKFKDGLLIDFICQQFPNFNLTYKMLNASDYGVPQNRERVFIIGIRKDLNKLFEFPVPTASDKSFLIIQNILEENPQEVLPLTPQIKSLLSFIPEGGSWKSVPYDKMPPRFQRLWDNRKKNKSPNNLRRFARTEIAGTITASAQPEKCGILHPTENRRYSVREVARIQSFPDTFVFIARKLAGKYKVIGNAVPPRLAFVLATALKQVIYDT